MNFNKQDREYLVTLSPSLALRINSAKGLSMGREMLSVMIPLRGLITELRSA